MLRLVFATIAMVVGVSMLVVACAGGGSQPAETGILFKFQTALKDVPTGEARTERARAFAASLAENDRLVLARALAAGTRQDDALFAAGLLIDLGVLQEAAPAFARFVVDGGDLTAHFWKWLHGQDPKTAPRAYIAIARALLAQIESLTGERRRAAEAFLLDAGYGPRLETYSRSAVEAKLSALEREIR